MLHSSRVEAYMLKHKLHVRHSEVLMDLLPKALQRRVCPDLASTPLYAELTSFSGR